METEAEFLNHKNQSRILILTSIRIPVYCKVPQIEEKTDLEEVTSYKIHTLLLEYRTVPYTRLLVQHIWISTEL